MFESRFVHYWKMLLLRHLIWNRIRVSFSYEIQKCCESRVQSALITRGICVTLPNWTMHSSRILLFRNDERCNFLKSFQLSFLFSKILQKKQQHRKLTLMDIISKISKYFRCFNWSILLSKASISSNIFPIYFFAELYNHLGDPLLLCRSQF